MAKNYIFKIPSIKTQRTYTKHRNANGELVSETVVEPLRNLDKTIYVTLFQLAASTKKTIPEVLLAQDCVEQIKNLSDKENIIKFTDADIKLLSDGYELTSGLDAMGLPRRPSAWMDERRELFEQIKTPLAEDKWLESQEKELGKKKR